MNTVTNDEPAIDKRLIVLLSAAVFVIALLFYLPTVRYPFVWDDLTISPYGLQNSGYDIFKGGGLYYRPFLRLSQVFDYAVWGRNAMGFHLTNVLLNAFATVGAFGVGLLLLKDPAASFIATLIFVAHPVHPDSVAWVSGRTDILASMFFFFGLAAHMTFRAEGRRDALLLSAIFFLFALFGKESAVALPLVVLAYDLIIQKVRWREALVPQLYFGAVTAAYFVLRKGLRMSGSLASHSDGAPGMQTPLATGLARMSDVLLTFGFYIKKLIVPWSMFQYPAVTSASNLLFLALFGVLFVLAVRRRLHIVSFACSFTALTILPSLSVLFIGKVGADAAVRYLYLPVFGVALAAGYLVKSVRSKHTVIAGLVAVVTLLGVVAHQRNVLWKDDLSLWTYEVRENPDQAMGHVQYALALKNTKRYDEAEREINFILKNLDSLKYRKSMDIRCSMVAVEGSIAIEKQDLSAAESYFLHARDCNKDIRGVDFALGNIYLGRYLRNRDPALVEKANRFFREEAAKGGGLEIAYALGQTNELMGNAEQAVRYYEEVIETAPRSRLAYNAYMALYRLRGAQSDNALEGR